MRKLLITTAFIPFLAMADTVPGMVVSLSDGTEVEFAISQLQSIKYVDGAMVVNGKDHSKQSISLDDIQVMRFASVSTAIGVITSQTDTHVTITDLSGHLLYQGESASMPALPSLRGTYIITSDGESHTVIIGE